jgi:group I intron endonuclease
MEKVAAIYVIANKVNHKIYLGSTLDFKGRINKHFRDLRMGNHHNNRLQNAWNKYGKESFVIFPIEEFARISVGVLIEKEAEYIKRFNLIDPQYGYNIQRDPSNKSGKNNPMFGIHRYGKNNPHFKGGPIRVACSWCGKLKEILRGKYNKNKKYKYKNYCSEECRNKAFGKRMRGKNNPWVRLFQRQ